MMVKHVKRFLLIVDTEKWPIDEKYKTPMIRRMIKECLADKGMKCQVLIESEIIGEEQEE